MFLTLFNTLQVVLVTIFDIVDRLCRQDQHLENVGNIMAVQHVGDKNVENLTQVLSLFKTVKGQIHK